MLPRTDDAVRGNSFVHGYGCDKQVRKRAEGEACAYLGFVSATAGTIRQIVNSRQFRFVVIHDPTDDSPAHSEVRFAAYPDKLKFMLQKAVGQIVAHKCPA